jgi:hypothetical protein
MNGHLREFATGVNLGLPCLAAACFAGSREAMPTEIPGCVQEATANGGLVSGTAILLQILNNQRTSI